VDSEELLTWLDAAGYTRVGTIDGPGAVAVRGGIVDVYPAGGSPARIDLFGDEVDSIAAVDLATMGSDARLDRIDLVGASLDQIQTDEHSRPLTDLLPANTITVLADGAELAEQGRSYLARVVDDRGLLAAPVVIASFTTDGRRAVEIGPVGTLSVDAAATLPVVAMPAFAESVRDAILELAALAEEVATTVVCQNDGEAQRIGELLEEIAPGKSITVERRYLHRGFVWTRQDGAAGFAVVPYHELVHRYQTRRRIARIGGGRLREAFLDLEPGDYVVHRDHGIARFTGMAKLGGGSDTGEEYLTLEFSGSAKLHVPASHIDLVQKYIGAFKGQPELSKLGGKRWKRQKERVEEAVEDLASEMLRLQGLRESLAGITYPADTTWQREFEAAFPYPETDDQVSAISAIKSDMAGVRPMDRLVCGDVGFGKTEVAIRAAFKAAEFGKQVAILVPTTWLAEQHEMTFRERFADYPFTIESISRFKTAKQQREIVGRLALGQIDVVIGTHRLLSKDVRFADLGLVVIDEEQRFGVEHKQRLRAFRATADVITMTATPIPRTLHMSMLGLRDISALTTAPLDRRAVVTEVMSLDAARIARAIRREMAREGQVFFVHNRVNDIQDVADMVQRLAPDDARVIIGHGQMPSRELETVMRTFIRGKADILVSTTIIESG
ncbi:MAG: DEAD/DEAH box helicase, partial [Planctomycetota bacterium]